MARKKKVGEKKQSADTEQELVITVEAQAETAGPCCTSGGCSTANEVQKTPEPEPANVDDVSCSSKGCCSGDAEPVTKAKLVESVDAACATGCCGSPAPVQTEVVDSCCSSSSAVKTTASPKKKEKTKASSCCVATDAGASCCTPKPILVAPADKVTSCCSAKSGACSKAKAKSESACKATSSVSACKSAGDQRPTTKVVASNTDSMRLSIGGMTCSGCCTRIEGFLREQPGIVSVNVSLLTGRGVFQYDPYAQSPATIEKMVKTLGFTATPMPNESLASVVLHVGRESPVRAKQSLLGIEGVVSVRDHGNHHQVKSGVEDQNSVVVDYDPDVLGARTLVTRLSKAMGGLPVHASTPRPHALESEEEEVTRFARYLLWSFVLSLPVLFVQYIVPWLGANVQRAVAGEVVEGLSWQNLVGMVCSTPILFIIAYPIHESAFLALRFGSRVTMDVLVSLSSFSAYVFSIVTISLRVLHLLPPMSDRNGDETFFEVTALLITLILLGRYFEKIAKSKASHSVDALLSIQAKTAILLEKDAKRESSIDVLLVERGDLLKVLPGARVPTDGVVVEGASAVDESMVTGESRKVTKGVGSTVIGGTINAQGVLVVRVTHTINESMLARIVNLVDEAQSSKCEIQSVADTVSSYFTTFIITVAVIMFVVWYELASGHYIDTLGWAPLPFALRFAITILVISCPCAISLAVPTAIMVATTVGSQFGVLFKGGLAVEALGAIDVVMFDKTGTLTTGKLQVVDSVAAPSSPYTSMLWSYLAAAERNSEHAIAKAISQHSSKMQAKHLDATAFESVPGCGVQCRVDGHVVNVGSFKWMQHELRMDVPLALAARNETLQREGCVVVCVAVDNALVALVALQDTPRPEAQFVIEQLQQRKIQTWIVTGDQRETALSVAAQLGISSETVIADALPHQKVDKVRLLQGTGKHVAFIGDGVNDGPALAMANIGVAIGAGTDVAIEAADLVLVKDDLRDFLNALDLSKATNRLIRWNFTWGFLYNLIMMPVACGALYPFFGLVIPPAFAGLSELFSSVPVILFSLLLNWWTPPFKASKTEDITGSENSFVAIDVKKYDETTPLLVK